MERHDLRLLIVRRNPALGLASWCHSAAILGNPELCFGPTPGWPCVQPLVGPGFDAPKCEIVGIGGWPALWLLRFNHLIGNGLALAIVHSFFLGFEVKGDLPLHVAGAGPAHQRLDHLRLLGFVFKPPLLGYGGPRLHSVFGGLKDACGHGWWDPARYASWKRVVKTARIV